MNEEKKINEQELDQVSGGTGGGEDAFDAVWEKFARTYCDDCAIPDRMICDAENRRVRSQWEAGEPLKCMGYMSKC